MNQVFSFIFFKCTSCFVGKLENQSAWQNSDLYNLYTRELIQNIDM